MKTISTVQCGIKALEEVINRIVAAVNARTVVAGAGLTSQETQDSIVISLASKDDDHGQTGTQGGGGGGQDPHLLATAIDWHGVKWQDVTVVDPSTCAQSTLSVLVHTGDDNDTIAITVKYPFWVSPVP